MNNNQLQWIDQLPTWNARSKAYMKLIDSMNISKIELVRDSLLQLKALKVLSFGERKLLQLSTELVEAKRVKHLTVISGGK